MVCTVAAAAEDSHKKSFTSFQGCNISTATHLCYHFGKGFQSNYVRYVFFPSSKTKNFNETVEKLLNVYLVLHLHAIFRNDRTGASTSPDFGRINFCQDLGWCDMQFSDNVLNRALLSIQASFIL